MNDLLESDFHLVRIAHIENASENRIEKHEFRQKHSTTRFFLSTDWSILAAREQSVSEF